MTQQKTPKTKKVNFSVVKTTDLEGKPQIYDVAKSFGNALYKTTVDLEGLDLAQRIHKDGEVELSAEDENIIRTYVNSAQCHFIAVVKVEILAMMQDDLEK